MKTFDWQERLNEQISVEVNELEFQDSPAPQVISFPIPRSKPHVQSHCFEAPPEVTKTHTEPATQKPNREVKARVRKKSTNRIQPPRDVVKLADRLFYLLQPPLEVLLQRNTMELPFEPFDFQYSGVAFMFSRHAAILADEMGLGKTMQAITTLRMLLRSGHIRNVLLICPKPLVTNWQRELKLWAPEVPVSAVTGNQGKRHWQWEHDKTAVKIANYELIVRDVDVVTNLEEPFDLVVIDEAQRIKNKSSATSKAVRDISRRRSWALTGTPIENSIEDLFGIFEFVAPGAIGPNMSYRELKTELNDFVLRRTKDLVIKDMPPN